MVQVSFCPICEAEIPVSSVGNVSLGADARLVHHMEVVHHRVFKSRELGTANSEPTEPMDNRYSLSL